MTDIDFGQREDPKERLYRPFPMWVIEANVTIQKEPHMIVEADIVWRDGTRMKVYADNHIRLFELIGPDEMAKLEELHTKTIPIGKMRQGKERMQSSGI